jgi:hypothetical protein
MTRAIRDLSQSEPSGPDNRCARLAAIQYGVISRFQARENGMSVGAIFRRVQKGRWHVVLPGIYRLAGASHSWQQDLMAAILWAAPKGVVSHRSAAALWKMDGFEQADLVEILTTKDAPSPSPAIVVHTTKHLSHLDMTRRGPLLVTTPERTLIDLGAVVDRQKLELALDSALREGLTRLPRLTWHLDRLGRRGRSGTAALREALKDRPYGSTTPASPLERRFIRFVSEFRLPSPAHQYPLKDRGRLIAVLDFAYPDDKLAIETDGYRYHHGRAIWHHDRMRRNALVTRGWRVLQVTWSDLDTRREEIADEVRRLLRSHRSSF